MRNSAGRIKIINILSSSNELDERKMRIRFFGNRKLLPERIQQLIWKIEALSRNKECK
jgi:undecaprenyl pyrophosphate synthase